MLKAVFRENKQKRVENWKRLAKELRDLNQQAQDEKLRIKNV
ncbi:hypothetical protein [Pontibacillus sp. ALD_SL1]|nr:hypothetical protein [Pontibacillus sp. ALD_SL1]